MVKIKNLSKKYDKVVFDKVNLQIDDKINYLVGENGSGKSTLLNIIANVDNDYCGQVTYENISNIVYLSQENQLLNELTFSENLSLWTKHINQQKLTKLLTIFNIEAKYKSTQKVETFSGGEQKKVHIIIGLMRECELLLIDEIDNHIDRDSIIELVNFITTLDCQIIISSHSLDEYMTNINYTKLHISDNKIAKEQKKIPELCSCDTDSRNKIDYKLTKDKQKLLFKIGEDVKIALVLILIVASLLISNMSIKYIVDILENLNQVDTSLVFAENSSLVYPPAFSSNFWSLGEKSNLLTTQLYFTSDDYTSLTNLDYVNYVYPIPSKNAGVYTNAIEVNNNLYVHDNQKIGNNNTQYNFEQLPISESIINNIPSIYYTNFNDYIGSYPQDNSNQILIDENYANSYASKLNLENSLELIGNEISVPVINQKTKQKENINLVVSGIYKNTDFNSSNPIIYTAVNENSMYYDDQIKYWDNITYEQVAMKIDDVVEYILDGDYSLYNNYYSDEETYYEGFYIEIDDSETMSRLTQDISKYDKNIEVLNNYSIKHLPLFVYLKSSIIKSLLAIVLIIITIVVINAILFKYYYNSVRKTLYLLKFYNFDDSQIICHGKAVYASFNRMLILSLVVSLGLLTYLKWDMISNALVIYPIIIFIYIVSFLMCLITNKMIRKREK